MAFEIANGAWIEANVNSVKGILCQQLERGVTYTQEELMALLAEYGLSYSIEDFQQIRQVLMDEGFLAGEE